MTITSDQSGALVLGAFRPAPGSSPVPAPLPVAPGGRHRAPETGEVRIVAAADCGRRGRHAAPEPSTPRHAAPETGAVAAAGEQTAEDPLAWLGLRFTAG
jgi:hypothetical protein